MARQSRGIQPVLRPARRRWAAHSARSAGVGVLAVALSLATASLARAQDLDRPSGQLRLGTLYLTPSLALENLGVDTNVFNDAENPKTDFTTTLDFAIEALMRVRRLEVQADGVADLVYFNTYSTERSINTNLDVRAELDLNRITLFAEGGFQSTRERGNFDIDSRARRDVNDVRLGGSVRLFSKLAVELAGRQSTTTYAEDAVFLGTSLRQALNRDEQAVSVSLQYALGPRTTLFVTGEAEEARFLFEPVRNNDSTVILAGGEFLAGAVVSGSAYIGFERFRTLDDALSGASGLVAAVEVSYELSETMLLSLTADRDVQYSFQAQSPYFIGAGVGGSLRRQLGGRFDATAGLRWDRYRYQSLDSAQPGLDSGRTDTILRYSGSIGYRLRQSVRFEFGGTYFERRSPRIGRDYEGLRIGMSVTYG